MRDEKKDTKEQWNAPKYRTRLIRAFRAGPVDRLFTELGKDYRDHTGILTTGAHRESPRAFADGY
eukprot:3199587-Pleurochrysis_carterae.AAC.1